MLQVAVLIMAIVLPVLLAAVFLSHASHLSMYEALISSSAFFKVVLYYLLLTATVNTPAQLRQYLMFLAGCVLVLTILALLQYHEVIDIPSLTVLEQRDLLDAGAEEDIITHRLRLDDAPQAYLTFRDKQEECIKVVLRP